MEVSVKRKCLMMSDLQSGATEVEYVLAEDYDRAVNAALERKVSEWVKCSERLPSDSCHVLVYRPMVGVPHVGFLMDRKSVIWRINRNDYTDVSHWMPLPSPPSAGADDANR
jgi:hypothetical protein